MNTQQSEISMWSLHTVSCAGRRLPGIQRRSKDRQLVAASLGSTCKQLGEYRNFVSAWKEKEQANSLGQHFKFSWPSTSFRNNEHHSYCWLSHQLRDFYVEPPPHIYITLPLLGTGIIDLFFKLRTLKLSSTWDHTVSSPSPFPLLMLIKSTSQSTLK